MAQRDPADAPRPLAGQQATLPAPSPELAASNATVEAGSPEDAPPGPGNEGSEVPPSLYGRFEAFEFLGRGGMGAVYKARDIRLGREVAIKLIFGADPERGGSLLREARAQARISHENVCEVYDVGTADHVRYIVMQLIHGQSLDKAHASMPLEERVRVVRQVAMALHEAHRLGLVHRDVKPANIMLERGEDGGWKPYIMDFGLAREMGDTGATVTGALMGTPAFMAPEQAAGRVRSLDRRTDVYGLGATLYHVLVGRPPFDIHELSALLHAITHEDVAMPRSLDRDIPQDLEAIVMKCLEKQPSARYESARALGDDLRRFLDGDPVEARRATLGARLRRRVKRHKGKVAVASAALLALSAMAGIRGRGLALAARQAELSRELGENVKEMEFFLRTAHGMPLHDIERERDIVRGRLKEIERRMAAAGEIGLGPGHHALGRGHLALQEPEAALEHLRRSEAAGTRSFGLDYAMGLTLGELYRRELEAARRIEGAERKKQRLAAIEASYRDPALSHLRAALGAAIEAPAYVEGLIAYHEGRHDEALAKAREAYEKTPWLYEAKKLEGDALFAIGSKSGHDAAFDHETMSRWFGQASEAYRLAAELGRSDPALHLAMCELSTQQMNGAFKHGAPPRPSFEQAKAACGRAIAASPRSGAGFVKLAWAHSCFAWSVATGNVRDEDPEAAFAEAIPRAEESVRKSPSDPLAHYVVGALFRSQALYGRSRGLSAAAALGQAISGYEHALRLDPTFVWASNELCSVLASRGREEALHGLDPTGTLEEAAPWCERALNVEPGFMLPRLNQLAIRLTAAEHLVARGRSPGEETRAALAAIERLRRETPNDRGLSYWAALFHRVDVDFALDSGGDPGPGLERIEAAAKEIEQAQPASVTAYQLRGGLSLARARWALERGEAPTAALRDARTAFTRAVEAKPWDVGYRVARARVEITALRWALREGKVEPRSLDEARAPLAPLLDIERDDPRLDEALASLEELRASYLLGRGADASDATARGLDWTAKALAKNPRSSTALACKGRLLLLRAGEARELSRRRVIAEEAVAAFDTAVQHNPLVARAEREAIAAARRAAGRGGEQDALDRR